jgi:hypothetical protein
LCIGGLHGATSYVNKERTFRLRIWRESSPFCAALVWPRCISALKTA